jgi:hypothetical protein
MLSLLYTRELGVEVTEERTGTVSTSPDKRGNEQGDDLGYCFASLRKEAVFITATPSLYGIPIRPAHS